MNTSHLPGFTADCSAYASGAHYTTTAITVAGAMDAVRPQRGIVDCDAVSRAIQHHQYLYGLDVLSGNHASALKNLQAIRDLENWLVLC
jgi:hypothetical protein